MGNSLLDIPKCMPLNNLVKEKQLKEKLTKKWVKLYPKPSYFLLKTDDFT